MHLNVTAKIRAKFKNLPPAVHGVYFLSKEQATVMLQSFQITAKLAEELLAMPEVLDGYEVVSKVANPTVYVPEVPAGSLATVNPAKIAGRAPSAVTTVAADSIPALRIIADDSGVKTMSSLDIVDYINHIRKPGSAILRHDDFMRKVPTVLGEIASPKFYGEAKYAIGNSAFATRKIYNFPSKEAIRMAMSYSYDLQAAVLDAWDDLTPPLPPHYVIAT